MRSVINGLQLGVFRKRGNACGHLLRHFYLLWVMQIATFAGTEGQTAQPAFLREYLRALETDLDLFLRCPACPPDAFTYLRPVREVSAGVAWITQPFYPENYGIRYPERHPVLRYMQRELRIQQSRPDAFPVYLLEQNTQLIRLRNMLKALSLDPPD